MYLRPNPPNQFSPDKPITLRYSPWTPVSSSFLMFPSATNTNLIRPELVYLTPLRTKNPQNGFERKMNIPTPRDALLTSSPSLTQDCFSSSSAHNGINHPTAQNVSTPTNRPDHYAKDASSTSYPPPPLHIRSANYFPSEFSQPGKTTTTCPKNGSLNDYGTKECSQCPNANKPPTDDLHDITDLYPSETINIADYLPVIFS